MAAIRRGQEVTQADVERTIENARAVPLEANMEMIHVIPQEYVVDGNDGIKDPVGMSGVRLEVDVHIVAGAQGPLQNLRRCARDAGIEVEGVVVQALASGLAVIGQFRARPHHRAYRRGRRHHRRRRVPARHLGAFGGDSFGRRPYHPGYFRNSCASPPRRPKG